MNQKVTGKMTAGRSLVFALLLGCCLFLFAGEEAQAAFPADMKEKNVTAWSLNYDTVTVYADKALERAAGQVDGGRLVLTASEVSEKGIYGVYVSGEDKGKGWFALTDFVADPSYKNVYATVRDGMYIYTDSAFDEVRDTIKKYSGIIVISKEGGNRQVIYEKDDGYGIGWMTDGAFSNTLVYDGREKMVLASGDYLFRCGYEDDENGGAALKKQTALADYTPLTLTITGITRDNYYLQNKETGQYLTAVTGDGGVSFEPFWSDAPDEKYGQFYFTRIQGSFCLQNTACRLFLGEDKDGTLIFEKSRDSLATHWRISALQRMLDVKSPMVFTQYDPKWCATPYGGGGCMGTAGCGVLATVNAVYALSGQYMSVMELADYAVEKNYRIVGSGTDDGIFKAACKKFGKKYNFAWDGSGGSIDELKKKLQKGDTAVVHVQGHYVAIAAYSKKKNKYLLLDSNYLPKRATSAFGDWISVDRLLEGSLEAQCFYYFKLRDEVEE